ENLDEEDRVEDFGHTDEAQQPANEESNTQETGNENLEEEEDQRETVEERQDEEEGVSEPGEGEAAKHAGQEDDVSVGDSLIDIEKETLKMNEEHYEPIEEPEGPPIDEYP
uniref:hypothetical protein n=1 Tax=Salmonella sp. s54412 TaxID=3160128 RepID=UPI003754F9EE